MFVSLLEEYLTWVIPLYFFLKIYRILDLSLTCSALLEESKLIEANAGVDGGGAHIVRVRGRGRGGSKEKCGVWDPMP
jgi:hypothetical protein